MEAKQQPVYFDSDTVSLLRKTLEVAWESLRPEQRATLSRTLLAEGILKSAAQGERDPDRLHDAALMAVAAWRLHEEPTAQLTAKLRYSQARSGRFLAVAPKPKHSRGIQLTT